MNLLEQLLLAYIRPSQGLFFALGHVALLVFYGFQFRRISVEASSLGDWEPHGSSESQCARALDDFVRECEEMAPQGMVTSLTDFTDRLDSVVDGMIGRLHDLVNLFLVVGIAGTVFGMYGFVVGQGDLNARLATALGRALPVAFMGLVFYVLGYVAASTPEQELRDALSEATCRALDHRRGKAKSIVGAIQAALRPLELLQATLTEVIEPVIKEWGRKLEGTYDLVREQMAGLQQAVKAVNVGVEGIRTSVDELKRVAGALQGLLEGAPAVLSKLDQLYAGQLKRLGELSSAIEHIGHAATLTFGRLQDAIRQFEAASEKFAALPDDLRPSIVEMLRSLAEQILSLAREQAGDLGTKVNDVLQSISAAAGDASQQLQSASQKLEATLQAFRGLPEELHQAVEVSLKSINEQLPELWKDAIDKLHEQVTNVISRIRIETTGACAKIEAAAQTWRELGDNARGILQTAFDTAIENVTQVAHKELPKIEEAFCQRFPDAVRNMKDAVSNWEDLANRLGLLSKELSQLLEQVRTIQFPGETIAKLDQISARIQQCSADIVTTRDLLGDGSGRTVTAILGQLDSQVQIIAERQRKRRWPPWPWAHG